MKLAASILSQFGFASDAGDQAFEARLKAMTAPAKPRPRLYRASVPSVFRFASRRGAA